MLKRINLLIVFSILLFCIMSVTAHAEIIIIGEWQHGATATLYNYDLTDFQYNEYIYMRYICDTENDANTKQFLSSRGLKVETWNEILDIETLDYKIHWREIPLKYDNELYTIDGQHVVVTQGCYEGSIEDIFQTDDGRAVVQDAEYIPVFADGEGYWNFTYRVAEKVSINFDANGGYGIMNPIIDYEGKVIDLPYCTFSRPGYTFSHWSWDDELDGEYMPMYPCYNKGGTMLAVWIKNTESQDNNFNYIPWYNGIISNINNSTESNTNTETIPYECPYTDISKHWGKKYIEQIAELGLVDGITATEFKPDSPMTREMFMTAMARLAGIKENCIDWAIEQGLLKGYGNGDYGLNDTVTREQMAVIFKRFFEKMKLDLSEFEKIDMKIFADNDIISDWAVDDVYDMQKTGLIKGKDNNIFDPQEKSTRAEACTVIYNLIQLLAEMK